MHPVKQLGTALFAAMGTNTWFVSASAATECAVPAACTPSFAGTFNVGTRDYLVYAAQWLAYALPCRRFAVTLAGANARLGADADRYSFTVVDLHHQLSAGFTGAPKIKIFGKFAAPARSIGYICHKI